ncbi:P-loop containing nucleoside triphosphate hydrolase [Pseudocohnilembus persalinus]|uniref:p-loop containing nucleoside triphosphate hydrolase n=1 Tax=Pseudocohnilembus persalinus TaxID=266149 RepID=A0A0V0R640_PSEPJ|nr:P-loop containing nucleoside triphosphate hydrolase [Pseudocohnilembus persalinus]|eukprot:KRX09818.1 P-loop containing nucleoside triphosphate hydrolase [Pseudocohnilembus persalinus]
MYTSILLFIYNQNQKLTRIKNLTLTTMDLGYQQKTKSLWKHYTKDIEGIIFIVDSSDTQRIQECISTFHENVLSDENCKDVPVIIFANKQDIKKMEKQQIIEHLKLDQFQRNEQGTYSFDNQEINKKYSIFNWHVQECQANKNLGIMPGFEWLSQQINLRRKFMKKKENQKNKTV